MKIYNLLSTRKIIIFSSGEKYIAEASNTVDIPYSIQRLKELVNLNIDEIRISLSEREKTLLQKDDWWKELENKIEFLDGDPAIHPELTVNIINYNPTMPGAVWILKVDRSLNYHDGILPQKLVNQSSFNPPVSQQEASEHWDLI